MLWAQVFFTHLCFTEIEQIFVLACWEEVYSYPFFIILKNKTKGGICDYLSVFMNVCVSVYVSPQQLLNAQPMFMKLGTISCHLSPTQGRTSEIPTINNTNTEPLRLLMW
jgi:hypothetical protein